MLQHKQRYGRNILISKLISIIAISSLIAILIYNIMGDSITPSIDKQPSHLKKYDVAIKKSVIEGSDLQGKNYTIKSESILKSSEDIYRLNNIIGLYNIGQIGLELFANMGAMNDKNRTLHLEEQISLEYNGYILNTSKLDVDLKTMSASTNEQVNVTHDSSNVISDTMCINSQNNTIDFEGNVRTYVNIADF